MSESRIAQRQVTHKSAAIYYGAGVMECVVRNLSETGACIEVVEPWRLPSDFTLIVKPEYKRRPCRVVWRSPDRLGVSFV